MKKVLFTATVDSHILAFHIPYLKYFQEQGYEVHVATNGTAAIPCSDVRHTVSFAKQPFKPGNLKAVRQLKRIIDAEQFDIIHTHTPMGSVVTRLAAQGARRKHKTRVIYTAHGLHFYTGAPLINWALFYPVERFLARYTDTLITINQEDYDRAHQQFKTNVVHIPGVGIDERKFNFKMTKKDKAALRASLGLKDSDFVMIYPAELNKNKNQGMLITAMEQLVQTDPSIHLLLPGQDNLSGYYQEQAAAKRLNDNIHFLGYRTDVPRLLKVSDVAVSTSLREGLPVNILEAMYAGLPVVATDCRGNQDLVKQSQNDYLVGRGDFKELTRRILSIKNRKSPAAKKNSQFDSYSVSSTLAKTAQVYDERTVIHLLSSNKFSGAENVVCELIKSTATPYKAYYCSPTGEINGSLEAKGIDHVAIKQLSYREVGRIVKKYRPDVIHAHDFKASIIASLFHKEASVISHIHQDPAWLDSFNLRSYLYKIRLSSFSRVFVVADSLKKNKTFQKISEDKLKTMHNKVNKEAIIAQAGSGRTKKYDLGFCGRLEEVKQPLDFIKIVAQIKKKTDVKAVMVGGGSLMDDCMSLISELGLRDNIELVGFQDNPYEYLKKCKLVMITSQSEGFGLVAIETALLGIPLISYPLPSIKEIFGDSSLSYEATIQGMANAYLRYKNSPKSYDKQVRVNRKKAEAFTTNGSGGHLRLNDSYGFILQGAGHE